MWCQQGRQEDASCWLNTIEMASTEANGCTELNEESFLLYKEAWWQYTGYLIANSDQTTLIKSRAKQPLQLKQMQYWGRLPYLMNYTYRPLWGLCIEKPVKSTLNSNMLLLLYCWSMTSYNTHFGASIKLWLLDNQSGLQVTMIQASTRRLILLRHVSINHHSNGGGHATAWHIFNLVHFIFQSVI